MTGLRRLAVVAAGTLLALTTAGATAGAAAAPTVPGVAVGAGDAGIDWAQLTAQGVRFAYVEDTTGTSSGNPSFAQEYAGAAAAGMFVGATHFALPNASSGAAQADYLLGHGGGWSADSGTLPPVLDIETNPYGGQCYGLSAANLVSWIGQFTAEVHARTSRWPVVYTSTAWWVTCTGSSTAFGADPLWVTGTGALPPGWTAATFRSATTGNDTAYQGTEAQLNTFANG
jgi:GH25 family lysozyme M1 (1,4-beta-N-acetylmuramidase)